MHRISVDGRKLSIRHWSLASLSSNLSTKFAFKLQENRIFSWRIGNVDT